MGGEGQWRVGRGEKGSGGWDGGRRAVEGGMGGEGQWRVGRGRRAVEGGKGEKGSGGWDGGRRAAVEGGMGGEGQWRVGWGEKGSGGWDGGRRAVEGGTGGEGQWRVGRGEKGSGGWGGGRRAVELLLKQGSINCLCCSTACTGKNPAPLKPIGDQVSCTHLCIQAYVSKSAGVASAGFIPKICPAKTLQLTD